MPEQTLTTFLREHLADVAGARRLVVGFSGGLDSTVLLHALTRVAPALGRDVAAIHVHHGLSPNADAWAAHAAAVCAALQVPLLAERVAVAAAGEGLEAAARSARRVAYARSLQETDVLLLAQHRGDQAETLLFRLFRGAGVTGLGAMRPAGVLLRGARPALPLWRPFLGLARETLRQYADARGLQWMEDESNADVRFARNFLRRDILPRLHAHWPGVESTLAATALRMQEAEHLLDALATELAVTAVDARQRLLIPFVLTLSPARQHLLLRYWLRQQGFLPPDEAVPARVVSEVMQARTDALPCVAWQGVEIRRYREHLYAVRPLPVVDAEWHCTWDAAQPLALPDGRLLATTGGAPALPDGAHYIVRFRRGGERFRPAGRVHSRELKTLLQEMAVPPWQRARLPLVFAGEELVGVPLPGLRSAALPDVDFRLDRM